VGLINTLVATLAANGAFDAETAGKEKKNKRTRKSAPGRKPVYGR